MKIIKFVKNGCMLCRKMEAILSKLGVTYETINLDEVDNASELIEKYGISSAPTLVKITENGNEFLSGIHTVSEIKEFFEV